MATPGDDKTARGKPRPRKKPAGRAPEPQPDPQPEPQPQVDPAEEEMTIRRASPPRPAARPSPVPPPAPAPAPAPQADSEGEATMASAPAVAARRDPPPAPEPVAEVDVTIARAARAAVQGPPVEESAADEESKFEEESTRRAAAPPVAIPVAQAAGDPVAGPDSAGEPAPAPAAPAQEGMTLGYQRDDGPPPSEVLTALSRLQPKLLVVLGGTKQVHEIKQLPFIVGRDPQVNCRIQHDTVSGSHAIVDFDGKSFTIEDLGSKNHTKIGNSQLRKGQKYELPPESTLRFAAAEALFFLEKPEEARASRALQERAGDILVRDGKLTRDARRDAARGSRPETGHLGARLILEADLRPADWSDAARRGREGVGQGFPLWLLLLWLLLALAVGTVVGWILYMKG